MTGVLYVLSLFSDATVGTVLLFYTQNDWQKDVQEFMMLPEFSEVAWCCVQTELYDVLEQV